MRHRRFLFNYSLRSAAVADLCHSFHKDVSLTLIPSRVSTVSGSCRSQLSELQVFTSANTLREGATCASHSRKESGFWLLLQNEVEHLGITWLRRSVCRLSVAQWKLTGRQQDLRTVLQRHLLSS